MAKLWQKIREREVGDSYRINFPDVFYDHVAFEHPIYGGSVEWNYEKNAGIAVLSNTPLTEDRYVNVKSTKVLGGGNNNSIRPPNELRARINRELYEGLIVVYLAHDEMLDGDKRSVYLLTEGQALELMNEPRPDREALRETLLNTPKFLPSPK